MATATATTTVEMSRRRPLGPLVGCGGGLVVVALFRRPVPADSDTPWHLAEGRLLLRRWGDGVWEIGSSDSFSWTARGARWHPNSWAFDAVLAGFYDLAGWLGVALFRVLLLASITCLAWVYSRRAGAGRWARAGAVWVSVVLVIPTAAMRPQLASFALLLACLELTARIHDGRRKAGSLLLALTVIVSAWSMLHGAVVGGVAITAAACAGWALDTRNWRRPALTATVAAAASCASPLGAGVWTYAIRTGRESRRLGIHEWQRPSIHRPEDVAMVLLLLAVLGGSLWLLRLTAREAAARRTAARPAWGLLAPAAAATALTLAAARNATFAVLAFVPLMAALLTAVGEWLRRSGPPVSVHPAPALVAMTIGGVMAGAIQTGVLTLDPDPLDAPAYPTATARTLPPGCRLLNEYHFGGYLILARPDIPVSQDGRNDLYDRARLDEQEELFDESDPARAAVGLDRAGITCVLSEPSRGLVQALGAVPPWRRTAGDATAQAWVRSA